MLDTMEIINEENGHSRNAAPQSGYGIRNNEM
jgi:hypothetical protein